MAVVAVPVTSPTKEDAVTIPEYSAFPLVSAILLPPTSIEFVFALSVIPVPILTVFASGSKVIVSVPTERIPVILASPLTTKSSVKNPVSTPTWSSVVVTTPTDKPVLLVLPKPKTSSSVWVSVYDVK